jgi:hypothetical protein
MVVTSNNTFVFVRFIIDKAKEVMPMVDMEALPSPFKIV